MEKAATYWIVCEECQGRGKNRRRLRKKFRLRYLLELEQFKMSNGEGSPPVRPKGHLLSCDTCQGSGLVRSENKIKSDTIHFPHVAIIGGGIGGVALAVACLHRGIPFTLFERDDSFEARSQGYGLTLQQASKALKSFGINSLENGIVSNKHVVHTTEGKVIGEWGMRKWMQDKDKSGPKNTNIHIARQSLRLALIEKLGESTSIKWGHRLTDLKKGANGKYDLFFQKEGKEISTQADLVVGADGIRSSVRRLLFGEERFPLRYLDCIVILGICPLERLINIESPLLDSKTVFQTANGNERIYMMPFTADSVMWQLSFPLPENEAKKLNKLGTAALKKEAVNRTQWHTPIPEIIEATLEGQISGYPVYDRDLLMPETLINQGAITLIGDAAHPMSPFKGQGANQALLDALFLARGIYHGCKPLSQWRKVGIRERVLNEFETEMLLRSASKVKDSAEAAQFLHSEIVLHEGDEPRGRVLKRKDL